MMVWSRATLLYDLLRVKQMIIIVYDLLRVSIVIKKLL